MHCMHVILANLLFEIIMVLHGVLSLPTWFSRDVIDDVLSGVCVSAGIYCFHRSYCMSGCHVLHVRFYNK